MLLHPKGDYARHGRTKCIRIIGGPFNGLEGRLQKMQGARTRRLFVELPNLLIVSVEVQAEFIELLKK